VIPQLHDHEVQVTRTRPQPLAEERSGGGEPVRLDAAMMAASPQDVVSAELAQDQRSRAQFRGAVRSRILTRARVPAAVVAGQAHGVKVAPDTGRYMRRLRSNPAKELAVGVVRRGTRR
jgi:uncharacterized protein YfaP (DUF2135 family)